MPSSAREAGWFYVYGNNPIGGSAIRLLARWVILKMCRWNLVLSVILEGRL